MPQASTAPSPVPTAERLQKGELAALVAAYLVAHPTELIGPTQLAKHLGRSQGAVANALTRLVNTGDAILVAETPRRFQLAS
jgi:DNA-binding MarR family transcriptional regulator